MPWITDLIKLDQYFFFWGERKPQWWTAMNLNPEETHSTDQICDIHFEDKAFRDYERTRLSHKGNPTLYPKQSLFCFPTTIAVNGTSLTIM